MKLIQYPYIPLDKTIRYVPKDNAYMLIAKEFARKWSLDIALPSAAVVVKDGVIIGVGANGSNYHKIFGCERARRGSGTGKDFDICRGCLPRHHSVPTAIARAQTNADGLPVEGSDLYLWGNWWFCESCWNVMIKAGINEVYLMEESEVLFHKEHPDNILGKQFE